MTTPHTGHVPGTSTNDRAERLMGRRDENGPIGIVLFSPVEQGYQCPVHQRTLEQEDENQTLEWSEHNAFVWCELCDRDYPSALCCASTDSQRAIEVYLDTVEQAVARALARL